MPYTGPEPARRPLSSDDITDGIVSTADLADSAVTIAKIDDATLTALSSVMSSTATAAAQRAAIGLDTGDSPTFAGLDATDQMTVAAGTVGAPAIAQAGDSSLNTGLYFGTANSGILSFAGVGVERMRLTSVGSSAQLLLGDTANAGNSAGLTINQGDYDDEALSLKSSDVAHGMTSASETDTFAIMAKSRSANGGLAITAIHESTGNAEGIFQVYCYTPQTFTTTKTTVNWNSAVEFRVLGHNGANGFVNATADGNVFSVAVYKDGGQKFIFGIDEDGDTYQDGTSGNAFDAWDDAALLRGLELWRAGEHPEKVGPQMLSSRFDANKYTKEHLEQAKLMQVVPDEEWASGARSLINETARGRVVTGAIWQNHEMLDALFDTLSALLPTFNADIRAAFAARGLPQQILDWAGEVPADVVKPDTAPPPFNAQ
jgi:hypothetical protein